MIISRQIIDVFINFGLNNIYNLLNDNNTLDYNWYLHKQVHPFIYQEFKNNNLDFNKINAEKHYKNNNDVNISPNLLHAIINNKSDNKFRDSMIEHSFERIFGLITYILKKLVITI